ncbi:MAG: hypothetical protein CW716_05550, partial [Candidatus Bathyarchaeum sp.]
MKMFVQEVFEVLYSPVKAFKKIVEKRDFKGVILVLVLVISAMIASQYVVASKLSLETRTPETDDWTEMLTGQHNWTSNGLTLLDESDYEMINLDGNHSISSLVPEETSIWMKLTDIESISCSEESQKELFFWIKWINEEESSPTSGTLKLFSGSEDSYFESDITSFLSSSGEWANVTLTVGSDQGWTSSNSPDWQSITGLEFTLDWSSSANLTMKIDGLFFRKFVPLLETAGVGGVVQLGLLNLGVPFIMDWILWSAILLVVAKLFQEDLGRWANLLVIVGYTYITSAVYTLLNTAFIATLPPMNWYIDPVLTQAVLNELWVPLPAYTVSLYLPVIGSIWTALLAAVVVYQMVETNWRKALTISLVAFGVNFILSPLVQ